MIGASSTHPEVPSANADEPRDGASGPAESWQERTCYLGTGQRSALHPSDAAIRPAIPAAGPEADRAVAADVVDEAPAVADPGKEGA